MSRSPLRAQQRYALVHLGAGAPLSPLTLGALLGTSKEGAAQTASSLIRRGLAQREVTGGATFYRITAAGIEALRFEQQELVP